MGHGDRRRTDAGAGGGFPQRRPRRPAAPATRPGRQEGCAIKKGQFTRNAQEALKKAREAAAGLGHAYIGSEHLLLGLAEVPGSTAGRILGEAGLDASALTQAVMRLAGAGAPEERPFQGLTARCRRIVGLAAGAALRQGQARVGTGHLLLGILHEPGSTAARALVLNGGELGELSAALSGSPLPPFQETGTGRRQERETERGGTRLLEQYARDLTRLAAAGTLDPVIGREREIRRVIQILCRRQKNNPALIGEPGVGKTAVAEGLARCIAEDEVPDGLKGKRLMALDLAAMVAGTKYRGEVGERGKNVLAEVRRAGDVILFLDELHTIVRAGSAEGAIDAANILKPALGRGDLQVIGATTLDEYRKYIEKDAALERRFQSVLVQEPDRDTALAILRGLRRRYESHHRLTITDEALEAAVALSSRYLTGRYLPDKAVDLIDEAASQVRTRRLDAPPELRRLADKAHQAAREKEEAIRSQQFERAAMLRDAERDFRAELLSRQQALHSGRGSAAAPAQDVAAVVADATGIPLTSITQAESQRLLHLEEALHRRVVGQEEAVRAVARAVRRGRAGLKEADRPIGSFLFLGPTGVGKTELCKALSAVLFGTEEALLRFDMSEYMERHTVSRLVGSPPGYVGYDEGGQLTERVRRRPYSVVLFDELEKAHPDVWSLLLQIMEDGVLTDTRGRRVDFRNTVVVMTSNVGAARITAKGGRPGFSAAKGPEDARTPEELRGAVMEEARKAFRPEFLNRLDEIVVFRQLDRGELRQIAEKLLGRLEARLGALGVTLQADPAALERLSEIGFDPVYGARPLRRALRSQVEDPAAELLLAGRLSPGSTARVTAEEGRLKIFPENGEQNGSPAVQVSCAPKEGP